MQEEELGGITEQTVDSTRQTLQASPQTLVIQQEKLLTWTSSPSPSSSPKSQSTPSQSGTPMPVQLQLESPRLSPASPKQPESPRTPTPAEQQSENLKEPKSPSKAPQELESLSSFELPSLPPSPASVKSVPLTATIPHAKQISAAPDILVAESSNYREAPTTLKHKEPDSPERRHENIRKKARDNTFQSAIRMSNYYNKTKCTKADDFEEGDMVSFLVPKLDSNSTDMQRIPGVILGVSGDDKLKFYKVGTTVGIIKNKFQAGSVIPNTDNEISIRQAAQQINAANKFTVNRCKCKGKCKNSQCSCVRSNINSTNHCHPGTNCENTTKTTSNKEPTLAAKDISILKSASGWLTDNHMFVANYILKKDQPYIDGLQDTLLQQNLSWNVPTGEFVQVLHIEGNHWITISNINVAETSKSSANTVNVYDSMYKIITHDTKLLTGQYHQGDKVRINIMHVQHNKMAVIVVSLLLHLLKHFYPTQISFIDPSTHLSEHLVKGSIPAFPSVPTRRAPVVLDKTIYYKSKPVVNNGKKFTEDILSQF